ncbi:MAG: hypothetical protein ABJO54_00010 [Hyphomicrobiales bacterium]
MEHGFDDQYLSVDAVATWFCQCRSADEITTLPMDAGTDGETAAEAVVAAVEAAGSGWQAAAVAPVAW